jgi:hypothetical protein
MRPNAVQQTSAATSATGNASDRLPPTSDLPQRPRTTSAPGVRIEGTRPTPPTSELGTTLGPHALHLGRQPARHRTQCITPTPSLTRQNALDPLPGGQVVHRSGRQRSRLPEPTLPASRDIYASVPGRVHDKPLPCSLAPEPRSRHSEGCCHRRPGSGEMRGWPPAWRSS